VNGLAVDALQALLGAWNASTPEPESNLAGWSSSQIYPCSQDFNFTAPNWRGVQCVMNVGCIPNDTTGYDNCSSLIVGLWVFRRLLLPSSPLFTFRANNYSFLLEKVWLEKTCLGYFGGVILKSWMAGANRSLENASIVGTLPPDIGNMSRLTTLWVSELPLLFASRCPRRISLYWHYLCCRELTGNPLLTGSLPATLNNTNLYTL
jgi:hypothetical protein